MLGSAKGARDAGNGHEVESGARLLSARASRDLAKRNSRNASKALLRRAWSKVTPEHLAEVTHEEPRRFFERLDLSEDMEPPVRWLLDVEGVEFEDAVVELRRERAAREKARGGR